MERTKKGEGRLETLDFVIQVILEHEKRLSELAEELEETTKKLLILFDRVDNLVWRLEENGRN